MAGALDGAQGLVADDDEDSLEVLAFIVSQEGATVRTANHATGVLELLLTWTPDLLLLDISMPVMDGFELLSSIRGTARLGEIPAVAVTAHAYEVDRRRCLDAGFAEHVGKPYDPEAMIALVTRIVVPQSRTRGKVPTPPASAPGPSGRSPDT